MDTRRLDGLYGRVREENKLLYFFAFYFYISVCRHTLVEIIIFNNYVNAKRLPIFWLINLFINLSLKISQKSTRNIIS